MTNASLAKNVIGTPLYESIEKNIYEKIRNGQLKPGQRVESTLKLAEKWNVSPTTVVNSLQRMAAKGIIVRKPRSGTYVNSNFNPDNETVETPNVTFNKKTAALNHNNNIAMVTFDNRFPEFTPMLSGARDLAHEHGLHIVIANTNGSAERFEEVLNQQIDSDVFGIYLGKDIHNTGLDIETLYKLHKSGIPIVCQNDSLPGTKWPCVGGDTIAYIKNLIDHMSKHGHKKIGLIGYYVQDGRNDIFFRNITAAFAEKLYSIGLEFNPQLTLAVPAPENFDDITMHGEKWDKMIENWLAQHVENLDAICCSYDRIAWWTLRCLERMGKKVPEDVALAGIGNINKYYGLPEKELTSIDLDPMRIGREIVDLLVKMRKGEDLKGVKVNIEGELIVGRSTIGREV
jgi:DNA-binding LacI/PurR family transcriptional regulator